MAFQQFADRVVGILSTDDFVVGLGVGGSWIGGQMDEYSDIDFVMVTKERIGGDKEKMMGYAGRFGHLLNAFTGEHVGEPEEVELRRESEERVMEYFDSTS